MNNQANSEFVETAFTEADLEQALAMSSPSVLEKTCAFLNGNTVEQQIDDKSNSKLER